jgi:hypothetical protein
VSSLAFATRSFTPLAFEPKVERRIALALFAASGFLWLVLIPLEFAVRLLS